MAVGIRVRPLGGPLSLAALAADTTLAAGVASEVDAVWSDLHGRNPALTDEPLFSVTSIRDDRIEGRFVPYRWRAAQMARPDLALQVRQLGVSGIVLCADGIVIGRRAPHVSHPGLWELVPSGGIAHAPPDWRQSILDELLEEVGIRAADVVSASPLCLIEDDADLVVDIGIRIETRLTGRQIAGHHRALAVKEYSEIVVMPEAQALGFLQARETIATSLALLEFHLNASGKPTR